VLAIGFIPQRQNFTVFSFFNKFCRAFLCKNLKKSRKNPAIIGNFYIRPVFVIIREIGTIIKTNPDDGIWMPHGAADRSFSVIAKSHEEKERIGNLRQAVYSTVNNMRRAEETMSETSNEEIRRNLAEKNSRRAQAVSEMRAGLSAHEKETR
jgi:hypothetical protein